MLFYSDLFGVLGKERDELTARLLAINGQAGAILSFCRFAVEEGFIDNQFKLKEHDTVIIIPPGSGG